MLAAAIDDLPGLPRGRPRAVPLRRPPAGPARLADGDPIATLSDLVGDQAAALVGAGAASGPGADPAAAAPWGHGVVGLVRSAADWWLRADRPMPRAELAAHLTDLAWAGLSGVVTTAPPHSRTGDQ